MTAPIPVTGSTPIYGLEYLLEGEPAFHFRQKWQRMVTQVEESLQAGGVAAPGASDLLELAGRVTEVETAAAAATAALQPGAWVEPALTGRVRHSPDYPTLRYRKLPAVGCVQIAGLLAAGSAATVFTLPVGFRPVLNQIILSGQETTVATTYVLTTGAVNVPATASWLSINQFVPLT